MTALPDRDLIVASALVRQYFDHVRAHGAVPDYIEDHVKAQEATR